MTTNMTFDPTAVIRAGSNPQADGDPGGGGGFRAMKTLDDYLEPEDIYEDDEDWYDPLDNSVWMPLQVGEVTPNIKLDEDYPDVVKEFAIDGGIDCSRTPYPVSITIPTSSMNSSPVVQEKTIMTN